MKHVDELMAKCPLKHEIRVSFWGGFIKKLKRTPVSYLTLYSPPLMDVKYFENQGFIKLEGETYSGVVGVGLDAETEASSNSEMNYRLELLLSGDINKLLDDVENNEKQKQLKQRFPFDVINLDYTDTLHRKNLNVELSPHIKAIGNILERQKKSGKEDFVLLVTTCVNLDHYNPGLLDDLKERFDENVTDTPGFVATLQEICGCTNADEYHESSPNNYFALALVKFLLQYFKDFDFTVRTAAVKWLVRDITNPRELYMLHLAFHVSKYSPQKAISRKEIGRRVNHVEHYSVKMISAEYDTLRESNDLKTLTAKHGLQIEQLQKMRFEIQIPKIKT